MQRKNPARVLDKTLWFSLGLFAGLIVLHQFLIQPTLMRMTSDAPIINLAGRQRMLSQKLTKAALALVSADEESERELRTRELADTLETWRSSHASLRAGGPPVQLDRSANAEIQKGFDEIEKHFQAIVQAAEILLANDDARARRDALQIILNNESEFLTRMHSLVGLYEKEARQHVRHLQTLGFTIMAIILGVQLMIQFGVLRPALSIVGLEWEKIEADYELLIESMTDGLVVFDSEFQVEFANQRFCAMVGRSLQQLKGQPAELLICKRQQSEFEKLRDEARETTGPLDFQMCCADGSRVDAMVSSRRMLDARGNFQGLLLVVSDITARKASEQRRRDLQSQLAHADRLKSMGMMAAALAHEINHPLAVICNYAEGCLSRLAAGLTDPTELVSPLRGILRASHRGAEIVRRTKQFARHQPHQMTLESINDLIHEVAELCRPEARRRGIHLELQLADELPPLQVDGIQIQQVLINLIQNGFHAIERVESLRRIIRLSTRLLPGDKIEVAVADSGPGISDLDSETLFDPFVTAGDTGTGLGLAIAREIVDAHEGRIWNENVPGGGAIFRFTLPLSAAALCHNVAPMVDESANVH